MFSRGRTWHDQSEEIAANASSAPPSAFTLPPPDHTSFVVHSESVVPVSGNRQLPATTTELAQLMTSAIQGNDLATVNHLLDQGIDPNIRGLHGVPPLHWAVLGGLEDIIKTLLDRGADPNLSSRLSQTPHLLQAAKRGNYQAVLLLLGRACLNVHGTWDCTALHLALFSGNATAITEIQNCLLDKGANINDLDCNGRTPLLWALRKGNIEGINTLLQRGANPDIPDQWGQTPLLTAIHYLVPGKINSMVNSLLANGANPNKPGWSGNTPLHYAFETARPDIGDILLANGARADIPNASGLTARDIAAACGVVGVLHNYMPPYQPQTLMACART
uniref:ankyrin repeat domain-containing protein n=1 Tax=Endozoicomonas sp. ONNA2 TaxID=2828741 RepID=UPI002147CDB0